MASRIVPFLLALAALLLALPTPGQAGSRVALVIGNGKYDSSPLRNPVNDAQDVAGALKKLGFSVILRTDADRKAMVEAARDFGQKARGAEAALFFYAGHGMQVSGRNYLIPVGSSVTGESEVEFEALDVDRVMAALKDAGSGVNIVVLDACRENPFRGMRASSRGLAVIQNLTGSVVVYATSPNSVAADGSGRNSPFTRHLLQNIATPGLRVEDVFKRVGLGVSQDTDSRQVPWISSSLFGDFYLAGGAGSPPPLAPASAPKPPAQVAMALTPSPPAISNKEWRDPVTGMVFVWVEGGCYRIGSQNGDLDEKPVHDVCLDGFWIGKYEVTQGQWLRVMGSNPSYYVNGDDFPVDQVSWNAAKKFSDRLSSMGIDRFRLPTEAEWEYAARSGGRAETYSGGENVYNLAWFLENSGGGTHRVGTKEPNGLRIYDMSGNVWEWCEDLYKEDDYLKQKKDNPLNNTGGEHVCRGGGWDSISYKVRASQRQKGIPGRITNLGLRIVRVK